jgi:hypothetical protein
MSIFKEELPETTVLSIGHRQGLDAYHTRTLHLVPMSSGGARLRRKPLPRREPRWLDRALEAILSGAKSDAYSSSFSRTTEMGQGGTFLQHFLEGPGARRSAER